MDNKIVKKANEVTNKATQFRVFLTEYQKYIQDILKPELKRVKNQLDRWRHPEYWARYARSSGSAYPNPIRAIYSRIKRPEKVVDKIFLKPKEYPDGISPLSFRKMHDCIGVRIIVYFLSQLPYIDRELRASDYFEISKELPPEAYLSRDLINRFGLSHIEHKEKESGYASVHYVVKLKPKIKTDIQHPWFEIQLRTLSQELWSDMEHILAYKSAQKASFSAKRRFQILSSQINAMDEHFNLLYEELIQHQERTEFDDNDELSPENLPYSLSLIGIRCAQQDFDTIIRLLKSRGLKSIKDFVNLATPARMETIRNTYITVTGRPPDNFELIASLGALQGVKPNEDETHHVVSHIEFSRFWNMFRKQYVKKGKNTPRSFEF
jgi:putative GTP pyrophosphokinase